MNLDAFSHVDLSIARLTDSNPNTEREKFSWLFQFWQGQQSSKTTLFPQKLQWGEPRPDKKAKGKKFLTG
jgi:hypothetical protein